MLFDTHTHAYFPELANRQDELIADMLHHGVRYATQIGCDILTSMQAIALAKQYEPYFATVGYHPTEGQILTRSEIPEKVAKLDQLITEYRQYIVAIGEIGFDYYHLEKGRETELKETQRILFFAMIELAKKWDLPVVIHTRNAREDTLRYIRESGIQKYIIHCFSEDYIFAKACMAQSDEAYFSFSGIVTYPKSLDIQDAAASIPLNRLLVETDAPFLSPQVVRGTTNSSANVRHTLDVIKNLRSESAEEIEKQVFENSLRVYGI